MIKLQEQNEAKEILASSSIANQSSTSLRMKQSTPGECKVIKTKEQSPIGVYKATAVVQILTQLDSGAQVSIQSTHNNISSEAALLILGDPTLWVRLSHELHRRDVRLHDTDIVIPKRCRQQKMLWNSETVLTMESPRILSPLAFLLNHEEFGFCN